MTSLTEEAKSIVERRIQVADQCKAVAHLATVLAGLNSDYERIFRDIAISGPDCLIEVVGERTAGIMEYLGNLLSNIDAVTEEDEWTDPIFGKAHVMFPVKDADTAMIERLSKELADLKSSIQYQKDCQRFVEGREVGASDGCGTRVVMLSSEAARNQISVLHGDNARLTKRVEELENGLEPFSECAKYMQPPTDFPEDIAAFDMGDGRIYCLHDTPFHEARILLQSKANSEGGGR